MCTVQLPPGGNPMCTVQLPPGGNPMCTVQLPPGGNPMSTVQLPPGGNPMCTVQLPPGGNPIAVNKYIISIHIPWYSCIVNTSYHPIHQFDDLSKTENRPLYIFQTFKEKKEIKIKLIQQVHMSNTFLVFKAGRWETQDGSYRLLFS
jgi:hypothetical protein